MESMKKLENTIGEWLKPLPHLPTNWRNWLAKNVWWLVLIGVILSVLGVLLLVSAVLTAMATVGTVTSIYGAYGISVAQAYTGWWYAASVASLAFLALTVVINAMAITPLKAQSKKGWDLLFLVFLIGIVSSIVSVVLNFSSYNVIANIFSSVIGIVIGAYFLFEIRSHFKSTSKIKQ